MRYAVISKGLTIEELDVQVTNANGRNVVKDKYVGEIFCDLDQEQVKALALVPGLVVKPVQVYQADQVLLQEAPARVESVSNMFYQIRSYFVPPITGVGLTVAVLDTGIRKTHQSLKGKVVYDANFTGSPSAADIFGHGTQVAFMTAGGIHGEEKAGVSPGAVLMNIKVINDQGFATDESIVAGIDRVCELAVKARENGFWPADDMYPNVLNLSLGAPDDGDPDNPVRVASRRASIEYGLDVVAAAGNDGPKMTTINIPACDPEVIAVGGVQTLGELVIWEMSSRGPTVRGDTKPDFVLWSTDLEMASHEADDEYLAKSGTSFSAPILSGLTGLLWESGRRAYGEPWVFRWTQAREFAIYFSIKPEGAALKKDNTYGFGMPAVGMMLGEMAPVRRPEEEMMGIFPMLMMMGLMTRMF